MRRLLLMILVALAVQGVGPVVHAKPSQEPASDKQLREAKRIWNQAYLAYQQGEYEEAIVKWLRSYELSGKALIFENIANAYERLGDLDRARDYLGRWRKEAPSKDHAKLDRRLENLDSRIKAQAAKPSEPDPKTDPETPAEPQPSTGTTPTGTGTPGDSGQAPDIEEEQPGSSNAIIAWTVTGVGLAAVVAGVVLDVVAATGRPDADEACGEDGGTTLCRAALREDIEASNDLAIAGDITWIAGGVVAVTGIVLLLTIGTDDTSDDESATGARVVPLIGPTGAGLSVTTTF